MLQPKSWVKDKEERKIKSLKLYLHSLIHGLLALLFLWDLSYWLLALSVMILHYGIDVLKLYAQKEETKSKWFFIDQLLHLIGISALWYIFIRPELGLAQYFITGNVWIYIAALIIITTASGIFIRELMSKWIDELEDKDDKSLSNAGKYIGILERLFVFFFIITSNWQGVGFLLAAKSVFRFGDLRESEGRKLTEYVLIGTLLSFGIAIAVGWLTLILVRVNN